MFRKYIFAPKYSRMNSKNNLTSLERKFVSIYFLGAVPIGKQVPRPSASMHGTTSCEGFREATQPKDTFYNLIKIVKPDSGRYFPFPPPAVAGATCIVWLANQTLHMVSSVSKLNVNRAVAFHFCRPN